MPLLLVSTQEHHIQYCQSLGIQESNIIHYTHPVKALDNLTEIKPDIAIFSANDFPRHWKPFLILLRSVRPDAPFLLLLDAALHNSERKKAEIMHIDGWLCPTPLDGYEDSTGLEILQNNLQAINTGASMPKTSSTIQTVPAVFTFPHNPILYPAALQIESDTTAKIFPAIELPEDIFNKLPESLTCTYERQGTANTIQAAIAVLNDEEAIQIYSQNHLH